MATRRPDLKVKGNDIRQKKKKHHIEIKSH
jgi:hypothetical protein